MIYALGLASDGTFEHFVAEARRCGERVVPIDLRDVATRGDWRLAVPDDGAAWVTDGDRRYDLDPAASYFCRLIDLSALQDDTRAAARWHGLVRGCSPGSTRCRAPWSTGRARGRTTRRNRFTSSRSRATASPSPRA
ncbi:hypothetical protein ACFQX6_39560 [Streptosporangium lutulentum]